MYYYYNYYYYSYSYYYIEDSKKSSLRILNNAVDRLAYEC